MTISGKLRLTKLHFIWIVTNIYNRKNEDICLITISGFTLDILTMVAIEVRGHTQEFI